MSRLLLRRLLSGVCSAALAIVGAAVQAHEYYAEGFLLVHPWANPTEPGATEVPVYFDIDDIVREDRLVSASAHWAGSAELRPGDDRATPALAALSFGPGVAVEFGPGNPHLLLSGVKLPLQWGRSYSLTMVFEKAGPIVVMVSVGAH
ncbi:MAG: copper chaperone PCu(A)C [Ramlibacter sp.]|nr:copper chaperone PCu(A)C [Ramlibacter sp.]